MMGIFMCVCVGGGGGGYLFAINTSRHCLYIVIMYIVV